MNEQELRERMNQGLTEMKPIIDTMTRLIMDTYQKGFEVGMELGKQLTIKED